MNDPGIPAPEFSVQEEFTSLDRVFGSFLCRKAKSQDGALCALGMKLVRDRRGGNSFTPLSPEEQRLLGNYPCLTDGESGLLVLEENKLYLRREFRNEQAVAEAAAKLLKKPPEPAAFTDKEIDDACGEALNDEQHRAVRNALERSLALITGGPGTGKSTVITAVAALELRRNPRSVIRIAAPTGKAAKLLTANLSATPPELQAQTLQSLFGQNLETGHFRHNGGNRLECDLLIVDECSMVPLALAAGVFRGLDPGARVVLAGDHRQLESIGSGNVLDDLLSARRDSGSLLGQAAVELFTNYRSKRAPRIQSLAAEIRKEVLSPEELCSRLSPNSEDCEFFPIDSPRMMQETVLPLVLETAVRSWGELPRLAADRKNREKAFALFKRFRILTANRVGPGGCNEMNDIIMEALGLRSRYAPGSALMVTQNSRATGLANGDTGLVFAMPGGGSCVCFENFDRPFFPHELPPHESAFATTVHKAQGSGFPEVFFLMPQKDSPLLTRELFYTALTRAAEKITVAGSPELVRQALARKSLRNSFLARRIARCLEDAAESL